MKNIFMLLMCLNIPVIVNGWNINRIALPDCQQEVKKTQYRNGFRGLCPDFLDVPGPNIPSGIYKANINVNSDGVVAAGANVIFQAGNDIDLFSGFECGQGSEFLAEIVMPCL